MGHGHVMSCFRGELLPVSGREVGASILTFIQCVAAFLVAKFTPTISALIGMGPMYLVCSSFCIGMCWFVNCFIPETRGKSLAEIERHYQELCNKNEGQE